MFGGYWALMPSVLGKIFGKPVYIILGGTECVSFPSINYGSLRKSFLRKLIGIAYANSTGLLPVDDSLVYQNYEYYQAAQQQQGFKAFFPKLKTPHKVIYNGFDTAYWKDHHVDAIPNTFITVAKIYNHTRFVLKGIDIIFALAALNPDMSYRVVGLSDDLAEQLAGDIPVNVECLDFLEPQQFKSLLQESQYFMCLSISEGFPNALAEGMLAGCIPIGSNVGGVPNIIGDTGLVIKKRDITQIHQEIRAFNDAHSEVEKNTLGKKACARITTHFPISRREHAFNDVLNSKN